MRTAVQAISLSICMGIGLATNGVADPAKSLRQEDAVRELEWRIGSSRSEEKSVSSRAGTAARGGTGRPIPSLPSKHAAPSFAKGDVVLWWNQIALHAVRVERTPPPLAARNLACVHAAIYDAVNAIYQTHEVYYVSVAALPGASPEAAAAAAACQCLTDLYPRLKPLFDREFAACNAWFPRSDATQKGADLGIFVAKRLMAWRHGDGSGNTINYCPKAKIGFWQLTPPRFESALLPGWGRVTAFAYKGGGYLQPAGLPKLTSAAYTQAFQEVKALGGRYNSVRTPEQTLIALFWADIEGTATPPGHWNEIAQTVARARGNTLAENARLFALLNLSLADAGIWCWIIKFTNEFWRPVTAIRAADQDGNPHTTADPTWTPLLDTPPFPAHTSGHSTFSAAASTVLADFFGTDKVVFKATSEGVPGVSRVFSSFSAAAEEAGKSRIYGGIHWNFDNVDGLATGRFLGRHISQHYLRKVADVERTRGNAGGDRVPAAERSGHRQGPVASAANELPIASIAICPDGRTLATDSWDTTALLWDLPRSVPP